MFRSELLRGAAMAVERKRILCVVALAALLLPACAEHVAKQVPVRGRLLVDGKPAAGAILTFHRAGDADKANLPYAVVGADGSFVLSTGGGQDGAAPGKYQVTIIWKKKGKSGDDEGAW